MRKICLIYMTLYLSGCASTTMDHCAKISNSFEKYLLCFEKTVKVSSPLIFKNENYKEIEKCGQKLVQMTKDNYLKYDEAYVLYNTMYRSKTSPILEEKQNNITCVNKDRILTYKNYRKKVGLLSTFP